MWNTIVTVTLKAIFKILSKHYRQVLEYDPNRAENIDRLLLVMTTGIGDTLMCTPAISTIRASFPQKIIGCLYHQRNRDLIIHNNDIDILIEYPGKGKKIVRLIKEIRESHFDLALVLHANDPDVIPLLYCSGIKYIIGNRNSKFNFLLSKRITVNDSIHHTVAHRINSAKAIGAEKEVYDLHLDVGESDREFARQFLVERKLQGETLIGLVPGGSDFRNRWPPEKYAGLANRLVNSNTGQVIIIGGKKEKAILERVRGELQVSATFTNGQLTLGQTAALVESCDLMVSNDTGLLHMTVALRRPLVAIYGGGLGAAKPELTGPYRYQEWHRIVRKEPFKVDSVGDDLLGESTAYLRSIEPEEVFRVIQEKRS
jgi:lipopolysaccharide heptosyltransferase II